MRPTIRDVARKAGVAVGTVSRVINHRPDVDPGLKARVEAAIRELNFRPNARARSFVKDASPLISFILGNRSFLHPVHSRILQGVEEYCEETGYMVIFSKVDYKPETPADELKMPRVLLSHGIADCAILAGLHYENFSRALGAMPVPHIVLANSFVSQQPGEPVDRVRVDDLSGAREAVEYLIGAGHQEIAYVGDGRFPWFRARHEGYEATLRARRLRAHSFTSPLSDNPYANGYAAARAVLEKGRITAVFCGDDDCAFGVCDSLIAAGVRIPDDISLIGFADQELAQYKVPPLTTVRIDSARIGRELARMAIEKMKQPQQQLPEAVVPTSLVKRGSVRSLAAGK